MLPSPRCALMHHAETERKTGMAKDKKDAELAVSEKKEKKGKEKESSKKQQGKIAKWFKDLKMELKKVVWPTKQVVVNNSIVVFAAMLGFAAFTFLLDQGFLWLFELAISGKS